jgi:hypothetical protein
MKRWTGLDETMLKQMGLDEPTLFSLSSCVNWIKNKDNKATECDEPVVLALANVAGISLLTGSFLPETKKLITDDALK